MHGHALQRAIPDVGTPGRVRWCAPERRSLAICAGLASFALASLGPGYAMAQGMGGGAKPLTIGARVAANYETNPAEGSEEAAEIRDLEQDEVIYTPSLTIDFARNVGRQSLSLSANVGYDYHSKNKELNRENITFSSALSKAVGSLCSVNGAAVYSRGQSSLATQDINVTKNTIQNLRLTVGETCATPAGLTQNIQVGYASANNSADDLNNYKTLNVSGSIGYSNDVIGTLGLVASYMRTEYDEEAAAPSATSDNLEVVGIGMQLSRPIGARLSGSAAVFYSHSKQGDGESPQLSDDGTYDGLTASANLTYIVGPRLRFATSISRDVSASTRQDAGYAITTRGDLTANYTVSSRISTRLGGSWSRDTYRGRVMQLPQTAPNRQDIMALFGGVSVQLGRRTAMSLDLRHEEARADLDLFDYTSERASLALSTSF